MRLRLLLAIGLGLASAEARSGGWDFLPRSARNGAVLDLFGSDESDLTRTGDRSFDWSDRFFRQRLTIRSIGYVYHPRFLQYQLSGSGLFKQEEYRQSLLAPPGGKGRSSFEYEGRVYLLPEHAYNLQLFALRFEPLLKERAATQHGGVQTSRGTTFRYRRKPYFASARYVDDTVETGVTGSKVSRLGLDGQYFQKTLGGKQLSLNASFSPSRFSSSQGLDGDSTEALVGAMVGTTQWRVTANGTRNAFDQRQTGGQELKSRQLGAYVLATAFLPASFRTDLTYRRTDNDATIPDAAAGAARTLTDVGNDVQLDVVHRLYQSLDSTYTFLHTDRRSLGGETTVRSHDLNLAYTKKIPSGRVLAGLSLGRGATDSTGRADVASEPHPGVGVPGAFRLAQREADRSTVVLFLRSPIAPFENVRLLEGVHYVLTPIGDLIEVDVLTLPAEFVVPGTYDFSVSYSLVGGAFALSTHTLGGNLSLELFGTRLTPYVSSLRIRSAVTGGAFPGSPLDSTTTTAGLLLHLGPWRARGEYQNVDWDVSPSRGFKGELQFVGALGPTTSLYATASWWDKRYLEGSSGLRPAHRDRITNASGSVRQLLFSRRLVVSAGGTFSQINGLSEGTAFSANAALAWKIGQLQIEGGATAYGSDTHTATDASNTHREHQYYYLRLRRTLF